MKKTLIAILAVFLPATAFAAQQSTPFAVQRVLSNAVLGERQAIARYTAFAAKADDEGYLGAAALFRAEAKAEQIHLRRFTALMIERNLPLPPEEPPRVAVASTKANLQTAVSAENAERDSTYLYAIQTANEEHDPAVAKVFDETRDVETEHANLCADALRHLEDMKAPHHYYVCERCGYTTDVPLSLCPSCRDVHPLHADAQ